MITSCSSRLAAEIICAAIDCILNMNKSYYSEFFSLFLSHGHYEISWERKTSPFVYAGNKTAYTGLQQHEIILSFSELLLKKKLGDSEKRLWHGKVCQSWGNN